MIGSGTEITQGEGTEIKSPHCKEVGKKIETRHKSKGSLCNSKTNVRIFTGCFFDPSKDFLDFHRFFDTIRRLLYKKMSLTQAQIARLEKLTALESDTTLSIDSILDSFDMIREAPVERIDTITRSGNAHITLRKDEVSATDGLPQQLLHCSPQRIAANQIVLTGIMHGE